EEVRCASYLLLLSPLCWWPAPARARRAHAFRGPAFRVAARTERRAPRYARATARWARAPATRARERAAAAAPRAARPAAAPAAARRVTAVPWEREAPSALAARLERAARPERAAARRHRRRVSSLSPSTERSPRRTARATCARPTTTPRRRSRAPSPLTSTVVSRPSMSTPGWLAAGAATRSALVPRRRNPRHLPGFRGPTSPRPPGYPWRNLLV